MTLTRNPHCTLCPLHATAEYVCLLGQGPVPGRAMIIGEAPGAREDDSGRPFVGASGQLLEEALESVELSRDMVYITNAVHCRPPDNRTPKKREIDACKKWLDYEIAKVKPKYVLLLGNTALQAVLGVTGIKSLRGRPIERDGIIYLPTYHPSFVLRSLREGRSMQPIFDSDITLFAKIIEFGGVPYERRTNSTHVQTWEDVEDMLDAMSGVVSFDIEGTCLYPWDAKAKVTTFGFGTREGEFSVLVHHPESPWSDKDIRRILRKVMDRLEDCTLVTHAGKFDALWMWVHYGIKMRLDFDTMLAHYLLDENAPHGLDDLARVFYNAPEWDIPLKEKQGNTTAKKLIGYHAHDLYYTRSLYFTLLRKLRSDPKVHAVFKHVMMPCANRFVAIEKRGLYLNEDKMDEAEEYLRAEMAASLASLRRWGQINWGSPKQVGQLLYGELGIRCPVKTKSGADSTSESALKQIDHACVTDLLRYRAAKQQVSFFIEGWLPFIENSRLHPSFKLHGTVTGRLSSEHPNCQQIPRDPRIRSIITAPPGWTLIEADLSQIELRIAAELSNCRPLLEVFQQGRDAHWTTALNELERGVGQVELVRETARVARQMRRQPSFAEAIQILRDIGPDAAADIDPTWKELRKKAKAVNFGYLFGMNWPKFKAYARDNYDMIITDREAQDSRIAFFDAYPLADWHESQRRYARSNGFVRSLSGRKRRLPAAMLPYDSFERGEALRQAINSPVQSFANEINLMVLLEMCDAFDEDVYQPVATIHDATLQETRNDHIEAVATRITEIMRRPKLFDTFGINLRVPIEGDVKIGPWGSGLSLEKWRRAQHATR